MLCSKGEIKAPIDGNLDRAYTNCAKCNSRRLMANMHAIKSRDGTYNIGYLCEYCLPTGDNA